MTLDYYNQNSKLFTCDTKNVEFSSLQDEFASLLREGATILDFGCGSGRDTKAFLDAGYKVDATDGSVEMCKVASAFTGIEVKQMLFSELDAVDKYDGIWACASILHCNKDELVDVINRMIFALHSNGIIYTSFKYGEGEVWRGERFYTDFTENSFTEFMKQFPSLVIEKMWISSDVRPGREEEKWLNIILRKTTS